jgi:hypothetical protein
MLHQEYLESVRLRLDIIAIKGIPIVIMVVGKTTRPWLALDTAIASTGVSASRYSSSSCHCPRREQLEQIMRRTDERPFPPDVGRPTSEEYRKPRAQSARTRAPIFWRHAYTAALPPCAPSAPCGRGHSDLRRSRRRAGARGSPCGCRLVAMYAAMCLPSSSCAFASDQYPRPPALVWACGATSQ